MLISQQVVTNQRTTGTMKPFCGFNTGVIVGPYVPDCASGPIGSTKLQGAGWILG